MAKRSTGVGRQKNTHSHKTKSRLAIKHRMLLTKLAKHHKHNRTISAGKLRAGN